MVPGINCGCEMRKSKSSKQIININFFIVQYANVEKPQNIS